MQSGEDGMLAGASPFWERLGLLETRDKIARGTDERLFHVDSGYGVLNGSILAAKASRVFSLTAVRSTIPKRCPA